MEMNVNNQTGDFSDNRQSNAALKKYLKIFFGVGCLGLLLAGGLMIWAGVATVRHVADLSADPNVQEQVRKFKDDISKMPAQVQAGCWEKVQSLMNVQVWLEVPVIENIQSLKEACLEEQDAN